MADIASSNARTEDEDRTGFWWLPFVYLIGFLLLSYVVFEKVRHPGVLLTGGSYAAHEAGSDDHHGGAHHGAGTAGSTADSHEGGNTSSHHATDHTSAEHRAVTGAISDNMNDVGERREIASASSMHTSPETSSAATAISDEILNQPSGEGAALSFERQLGDFALRGAEGGVESRLLAFIESDQPICTNSDCWFTFDRLTFSTGSSALDLARSADQLDNIEAILRAYPTLELKFGGYTDNRGDEAFNISLSQQRAEAVVAALVTRGIDAARFGAEGYGSQFPVATNDTPAGRAANRRVDVRVRKR